MVNKRKYVDRKQCPFCDGWFGFYTPKGGDGSAYRLRRHQGIITKKIPHKHHGYIWRRDPCPGSFEVIDR
jgi:hypothetical protein